MRRREQQVLPCERTRVYKPLSNEGLAHFVSLCQAVYF